MCSLSCLVFSSTPFSTFCVCSPRSIMMTPSTASSVLLKPNSPSRGALPIVTSPTSRTRTGTPFCEPMITSPMSRVSRISPMPAHVIKLPALRIKSAARVGVVDAASCCMIVRHGDVIAVKPRRIEQHLVLHHRAAESGIVRHARHLLVFALDHPVFVGLQFLRRAVGTLDHVAVDQARRAGKRRQRWASRPLG